MRDKTIQRLISRYRGIEEAKNYSSFELDTPRVLIESATQLMSNIPPSYGACAQMSASWAGFLKDHYSIPAIVVAGDLKINGTRVFKCKKNLPDVTNAGRKITGSWDGHCWIEIDGYIGDLSIFRTAYAISGASVLREFIVSNFGYGRGAMLSPQKELPDGMQYIPKFVLKERQIDGLIAGMAYQLEHGI